ncbi:adenylyltransferase/cytidyltransferase family protein [Candidatus Woesebacteria bacterium]|nr:adenylyltransferase/cytidyltransferase family protein [Candidatus Woesebacteria bacterium]
MKSAIITYTDLQEMQVPWHDARCVLVGGCFDVLHYGHIVFLQKAKEQGDVLVIALESDVFIKSSKKRTPIHSQKERAFILSALRCVDYVILLPLLSEDSAYAIFVQQVSPSVIAVTEGDPALEKKRTHAAQVGATICVVTPLLSTFSTTNILNYENSHRD